MNRKVFLGVIVPVLGVGAAIALWRVRDDGGPAAEPAAGFQEVALESGLRWHMRFLPDEQGEKFKINLYDHGSGVAVADFDGDGHDDIYFCNQHGPNALYRNKGDGTFEDVTAAAGVGLGDRVCVAATFADYDNDGRQDLFVTSTRGGNVLFHNEGNGRFKDVTKAAGLDHVGHSQACAFFDYDRDGRLDLLVTNTARWTGDFDRARKYYRGPDDLLNRFIDTPVEDNLLYHNNGDGTFTDVTKAAGLKGKGWCADIAVWDYDEDGWPDVLVTSMFGGTALYRNQHNGTFADVTRQTLGWTSWGAMGCKAFDFNNDGRLDLAIVDMHSDMWMGVKYDWGADEVAAFKRDEKKKHKFMSGPRRADLEETVFKGRILKDVFGNTLYKNLGGGKFREVSGKAGLETFWPWGLAAGDFDGDGHEDVFIPSGMGYPFFYWPNYLLMNNGDETFTDRAEALGVEPPPRGTHGEPLGGRPAARSSRAAAVADLDGDGRLDLIVNNFNDQPYYFKNRLPRKNYLALRLRGTKSNRDAVGAVVRLHVGDAVMTRQVSAAGGYLAQSSKALHFAFGDRPAVGPVEILWPGGAKQTLMDLAINRLHEITEPDK
jgi:hypothetical protein